MQRRSVWTPLAVMAFLALAIVPSPRAAAATGDVARGTYLVGPAGQCRDCHGPTLTGAPLDFLKPGMPVAYKSVKIAGLPTGWTAAQTTRFLESGRGPDGKPAKPPMPAYRFNHADAMAITAYLQSLK